MPRLRGWWRGSDQLKKTSKPRAALLWRDICIYRRNVRYTSVPSSCSHSHGVKLKCTCMMWGSCLIGPLGSVWTRYYCTYEKSSKMFTMGNTETRPASRQVSWKRRWTTIPQLINVFAHFLQNVKTYTEHETHAVICWCCFKQEPFLKCVNIVTGIKVMSVAASQKHLDGKTSKKASVSKVNFL